MQGQSNRLSCNRPGGNVDNAAMTRDRSNTYSLSAMLVDLLKQKVRSKNQDLLIKFAHILREKAVSGGDRIDNDL